MEPLARDPKELKGLKENQEITVPQVPLEVLVSQERMVFLETKVNQETMVPRVLREPRVTQVHQEMMETKETKVCTNMFVSCNVLKYTSITNDTDRFRFTWTLI